MSYRLITSFMSMKCPDCGKYTMGPVHDYDGSIVMLICSTCHKRVVPVAPPEAIEDEKIFDRLKNDF